MNSWLEPMAQAISIASQASPDVPVGAVLIDPQGKIVAKAHNQRELLNDPTAHAEIVVMRQAAQAQGSWRLEGFTLVVTLEPCVMCAGAIVAARIPRVVFGAFDHKLGAAGSRYDILRDPRLGAPVEVISGIMEQACSELLSDFFEGKR